MTSFYVVGTLGCTQDLHARKNTTFSIHYQSDGQFQFLPQGQINREYYKGVLERLPEKICKNDQSCGGTTLSVYLP